MTQPSTELVPAKPIVKIYVESKGGYPFWGTIIEFNHKLTYRGADFHAFATTGYTQNTGDSPILVSVLNTLMTGLIPIDQVAVKPFQLEICHNRTWTAAQVAEAVDYAIQRAGYTCEIMSK